MACLTILRPGARTLLQDLGFQGGRAMGIPPGGVMDRNALALLNALLGNSPRTEALEVTLTAPLLLAEEGDVRIALSGTLSGLVRAPDGRTRALPPWTATTLPEGHQIEIAAPSPGPYGLIGIAGGIAVPRRLGSRSTCLPARFGGLDGRSLATGDRLSVTNAPPGLPDRRVPPPVVTDGPIRLVPGPQIEWFAGAGLATLCAAPYRVSPQCDRMGMRLEGATLPFAPGYHADILSDGIVPGAIQVPGTGQPIILLADAQTTGGYAKIATVIGADLPRLSRLGPGDALRFALVTVAEAEAIAQDAQRTLADSIARIEEVGGLHTLTAANLIGGVVDMQRPDHFDGHLFAADRKAEGT